MKVVAVDPGHVRTAAVLYDTDEKRPLNHWLEPNSDVMRRLPELNVDASTLLLETMTSYGKRVGKEVFETVGWSIDFAHAWPGRLVRVPRTKVEGYFRRGLDRTGKGKSDRMIRGGLIERFGDPGTKTKPGTLYGIHKDVWAALAVAVYWTETNCGEELTGKRKRTKVNRRTECLSLL